MARLIRELLWIVRENSDFIQKTKEVQLLQILLNPTTKIHE